MRKGRWPCLLNAALMVCLVSPAVFAAATTSTAATSKTAITTSTAITTMDDSGHRITLPAPARRIVSLAPHTTELLFAAGAGDAVVGVSSYSDYPAQASKLPSVGSSMQLDLEGIVALKPDLILAWSSGNNARQLQRLRELGFVVFDSEPRSFEGIARSLESLSLLAGTTLGIEAATALRQGVRKLSNAYAGRTKVSVFYQIWPSPMMTLNGSHIVSESLRLCGAENIFSALPQLAPTVSREAVVAANPEAIFISDEREQRFDSWLKFPEMRAVRHRNLFLIDGTVMNRAGPRLLTATENLCKQIETARKKLQ